MDAKMIVAPLTAVQIGSRWRPGFVERKNTETGVFEQVNPPLDTQADIKLQRALLKPVLSVVVERAIEKARTAQRVAGAAR